MRSSCCISVLLCLIVFTNLEHVESRTRRIRNRPNLCKPISRSRIDVESFEGVRIEAINSSKVYIDSFKTPFIDNHHLSFEFKTDSSNGTLFYVKRRNNGYDMVSGELIDGYLEFKIRCKSSYADLRISQIRVNDGAWHKIQFERVHRKGVFKLDGNDFLGKYYVTCRGFTSLTVGNTDPEHVSELKERNGMMSACVRNVNISTGITAPPHYIAVSECV